jgi:hypothetical protein
MLRRGSREGFSGLLGEHVRLEVDVELTARGGPWNGELSDARAAGQTVAIIVAAGGR